MVCVEAANVGDAAVTLAPGAGHLLATTVSVTAGAPEPA
jgi:D-hexose-6-phosphate mutarotase